MTNELHYAYAVARTRAVEKSLLSSSVIDQLITADTQAKALRILSDNGWDIQNTKDYYSYISARLNGVWQSLCESAPDKNELEMLTVENDYHNIKTAVKCIFSSADKDKCYLYPTSLDIDTLSEASEKHDFSALPQYCSDIAQRAYEIGAQTGNGQRIDICIDVAALKRLHDLSKASKCQLLEDIARIKIAGADIKTAVRCASSDKDVDFISEILCECRGLDLKLLAQAACEGVDAVLDYIEHTEYSAAAQALNESTTAFEKWCDDEIMLLIKGTKWQAFGLEPLIAYYYANDAEIKTVRMILGSKASGVSADVIRERVRELYV